MTRSELIAAVAAGLPTNGAQEITAADLRGVLDDIINSTFVPSTDGTPPTIVAAPASASSAGNAGEIAYDAFYFYQCVATNTWVRSPMGSW